MSPTTDSEQFPVSTRKTVVVAGAFGGIGRALVESYRRENVALYLQANRRFDAATAWARDALATGDYPAIRVFRADFATVDGPARFCADVLDALRTDQKTPTPRLDAFVDAAGVDLMTPESKALSFDDRLRRVLAVDVVAAARTAQEFGEAARRFKRANPGADVRPAIVLFGWAGIDRGMEGETARLYAAGKGAVVAFARSLAQDLAPEVRINAVSPGWIRTTWGEIASTKAARRGAAESLAERWGTAAEVASVVRFLLSDAASYLNGQNVPVDGGFSYRARV